MTTVHIIATGGTIASKPMASNRHSTAPNGSIASLTVTDLLDRLSLPAKFKVTTQDLMTIGSYQLGLSEILDIANTAITHAHDPAVDGVVVTHGTDTLEETAFLTELLNDSDASVVFTGAQRSADQSDSDGPRNLRDAIMVAGDPNFRGLGAIIAFDGEVYSARETRKMHTTASQPFTGGTLVGRFEGMHPETLATPRRRQPLPSPTDAFRCMQVDIIHAYPGSNPAELTRAADHGASAVVLAGTGVGNAGAGYVEAVESLRARSIPVVLASRVPSGAVVPLYGNGGGVDLLAAGAISAGSLNPFQARILAAHLLSNNPSMSEFKTAFNAQR